MWSGGQLDNSGSIVNCREVLLQEAAKNLYVSICDEDDEKLRARQVVPFAPGLSGGHGQKQNEDINVVVIEEM